MVASVEIPSPRPVAKSLPRASLMGLRGERAHKRTAPGEPGAVTSETYPGPPGLRERFGNRSRYATVVAVSPRVRLDLVVAGSLCRTSITTEATSTHVQNGKIVR